MEKGSLAELSREDLVARAEALSVRRARFLTRPELVDEILMAQHKLEGERRGLARGFFGLARDLLARVVERGLHLPDAAERIRGAPPPPRPRHAGLTIATVTLAEIYESQGHGARAIQTLRNVLSDDPEHQEARQMLTRLEREHGPVSEPVASTQQAPTHASPTAHDTCIAVPVDPSTLAVHWAVGNDSLARLRERAGEGQLVLRLLLVFPSWEGPLCERSEREVQGQVGDLLLQGLPAAVVRVGVAYRVGDVYWPIAHSELFELAGGEEGGVLGLVRWTPKGREPLADDSVEASFFEASQVRAGN